ncbi:MAG TPA: DUF1848 family protein [Chloroflexi bacterium]|nr:DUF1848 family protein [Chloroflexota bacterium]
MGKPDESCLAAVDRCKTTFFIGGWRVRHVISASRRTDIVTWYAAWFTKAIHRGWVKVRHPFSNDFYLVSLKPEDVHTVVLWSKDFSPLLENRYGLRDALSKYDQLFCHFTITGLGATPLEPKVPPWQEAVRQLPELVKLVGDPRRVTLRFDPIIHWEEAGEILSNLPLAEPILRAAAENGITSVRISFATIYGKVRKRKGWKWIDPPLERKLEITSELVRMARSLGLTIHSCADTSLLQAGALPSRCIDGELLSRLHPKGFKAPTEKDRGQRPQCGCTVSIDIGSYTMKCPSGCVYCYAHPIIQPKNLNPSEKSSPRLRGLRG